MPNKWFSHRMLHGGGGGGQIYNMVSDKQSILCSWKSGELNVLSNFTKNNNY